MSYDGLTPLLKLPQWVMSDQLQVGDLNAAFSILDDFAGQITPQAAALRSASKAGGSWTPLLEQGKTPAPFVYTVQTGRYMLAGGFAFMACSVSGHFQQMVEGSLLLSGLPFSPLDDFPVHIRIKNNTNQTNLNGYTQNGALVLEPVTQNFWSASGSSGNVAISCIGLLPI